ncbi:unnamed protein product [Adineta ricciae]|uniref:Uncharacterized protein n=1 Tax=Adineta ricciae TaxID=249248 RepID=A0A814HLK4_ADIRI|nr:unnamed protein product [Adineta ricciae]
MRITAVLTFTIFVYLLRKTSSTDYDRVQLAANDYLFVFYVTKYVNSDGFIHYQCAMLGNRVFKVDFDFQSIHSVSIGRRQNQSQLYFIVSGNTNKSNFYMTKITVQCYQENSTVLHKETVFFENHYMSSMIVSVDPHGQFAVGVSNTSLLYYNLNDLQHFSYDVTWPDLKEFLPLSIDISENRIYIAGYIEMKRLVENIREDMIYIQTRIYLLSIDEEKHQIQFYDQWKFNEFTSNLIMKLSLRVNLNNDRVLLGIPSINTVYSFITNKTSNRLIPLSSKMKKKLFRIITGYGWIVDWFHDSNKAIIVTVDYESNIIKNSNPYIEYYDIYDDEVFNDKSIPFAVFPTIDQTDRYSHEFSKYHLIVLTTTSSILYAMNDDEHLLIIPSSKPGYLSVDQVFVTEYITHGHRRHIFLSNSAQCPLHTYKNDTGPWPCRKCQTNSSQYDVDMTCPECNNELFCPLEFATFSANLFDIEQYYGYPETPEIDVFSDILIRNMFRTKCLRTSPFLIMIITLLVILILSIIIGFLKFSKRLASKNEPFIKGFRYLDLIKQGQSWFGGLVSIVLFVLLAFAIKFSYSYHYLYPIENQHLINENSCSTNLHLNAKFESNLQYLTKPYGQLEEIFRLLDSQEFLMNIELINTTFHCGRLFINSHNSVSCYTRDFNLYASTNLSSHKVPISLTLQGKGIIEAMRIGFIGSEIHQMNNYVQKVNFSKVFYYTNRTISMQMVHSIDLQLTKIINITEGLTDSDLTIYSGLWSVIFHFDRDRLFVETNQEFDKDSTKVSLKFFETSFFIQNRQKPIARSPEIIFSTILFICMCLDLVCTIFLLIKLWLKPILKLMIIKVSSSNCWFYQFIDGDKSSISIEMENLKTEIGILKRILATNETFIRRYKRKVSI